MSSLRNRTACLIGMLAVVWGTIPASLADKGDKQGWSVSSDPRKRAFLVFTPTRDGPRVLVLGCLRDVDSFVVLSEQSPDTATTEKITLRLANGPAQYEVQGRIEPNGAGVGHSGFASEFDADAKALQKLRGRLLPVLEGKGPIMLVVGSSSHELPVAGLNTPLNRFKSICFGRRASRLPQMTVDLENRSDLGRIKRMTYP